MLPITVLPGASSENPTDHVMTQGLIDTGATGLGIRADIAAQLRLRGKGRRRVLTANGVMMAPEYAVRVGFVTGDYTDPDHDPNRHPYVLDREIPAFGLQAGFAYPVLIGMIVIGLADLSIRKDGLAVLAFE